MIFRSSPAEGLTNYFVKICVVEQPTYFQFFWFFCVLCIISLGLFFNFLLNFMRLSKLSRYSILDCSLCCDLDFLLVFSALHNPMILSSRIRSCFLFFPQSKVTVKCVSEGSSFLLLTTVQPIFCWWLVCVVSFSWLLHLVFEPCQGKFQAQ